MCADIKKYLKVWGLRVLAQVLCAQEFLLILSSFLILSPGPLSKMGLKYPGKGFTQPDLHKKEQLPNRRISHREKKKMQPLRASDLD